VTPSGGDELDRIAGTWGRYGASARKRRAWSSRNPGNAAIREELVTALLDVASEPLAGTAPILDVGCGAGWWLRRLAAAGVAPGRLYGVDLQQRSVESARKAVPGATVATADARALPYPPGRFGLVTLIVVLSSLSDRAARGTAIAEAARVLAPGGVLAIWDLRWPSHNRQVRALRRGPTLAALAAAGLQADTRTLTLAPPLARSLHGLSPRVYPVLAGIPGLRSHRLFVGRK
jgi:ubiquinone/menaquinone biosynthesis C-methylase UbiE